LAAPRHVSPYCGRDVEVSRHGFCHGAQEVVERHVDEWQSLDVVVGGRVKADVDATGLGDSGGVVLDRSEVEDVEWRDVRCAAVAMDALGDRLERCFGAAGEVHLGALAGERTRDRGADRASGTVDDRGFVVEQHGCPPSVEVLIGSMWSVPSAAGPHAGAPGW
jgi:hypothetical protein